MQQASRGCVEDGRGAARRWPAALLAAVVVAVAGCGGDARVELAAADALEHITVQLRLAVQEYNAEIERSDAARREAALDAFVRRVRGADVAEEEVARHTEAFGEALALLAADQREEWRRYGVTLGNVEAVDEVARGLRQVGIETLSVQDDVRRYLGSLVEARRRAESDGQAGE